MKTLLSHASHAAGLLLICLPIAAQDFSSTNITGITEPILDATLSVPVDGVIAERFFEEGDFVEKGEVILELRHELEEWEVKRRKVTVDTTAMELDRLTRLRQTTNSVSDQQLDKAKADHEIAVAEYELAKARLKDRQVTAPFSGYIVDFFGREVGEGSRLEDPLARLVDTRRCMLVCHLEAQLSYRLKEGQRVEAEIRAGDQLVRRKATITFISPVVHAASGLVKVKAVFDNKDGAVRPGVSGVMRWNQE